MNPEKEWLSDFVANEDPAKINRLIGLILVELFNLQTNTEQVCKDSVLQNNAGFTAFDARSGTEDAKAFMKYGKLSDFRVERWSRKDKHGCPRIAKYHGQINRGALEAALQADTPNTTEGRLAEMRLHYVHIRRLFDTGSDCDPREFDELVKARVGNDATPERFIEVARRTSVKCRRCSGTGQYITAVVNGRPTGPSGICFRCEGKGAQTYADAKRNWGYDRFGRKVYL